MDRYVTGAVIRRLRENKQMTQEDLALQEGVRKVNLAVLLLFGSKFLPRGFPSCTPFPGFCHIHPPRTSFSIPLPPCLVSGMPCSSCGQTSACCTHLLPVH